MNRRTSRQHKMHLIFALDFYRDKKENDINAMILHKEEVLDNYFLISNDADDGNLKIQNLNDIDKLELKNDFFVFCNKLEEIDEKIKNSVEGYSLDRIGKCEKAILRVSLYEILYKNKDEKAVYIDEAIELSKIYCDESAYAFVNSILDKV